MNPAMKEKNAGIVSKKFAEDGACITHQGGDIHL